MLTRSARFTTCTVSILYIDFYLKVSQDHEISYCKNNEQAFKNMSPNTVK